MIKSKEKIRVDQLLFQKGMAPSRERAQALILAGQVLVNDERVEKPSQKFDPDQVVFRLRGKDHPYVGRGGVKLAAAFDQFDLTPQGLTCLDVGASTGGFTDYLLQKGARHIYTLDSGTNQLDYRLRKDPRVKCREKFNVRYLTPEDIPEKIHLIVVDVSFISLKLVLPPLIQSIPPPWDLVMLIKPQFEAGKDQVEKGGLVKDPKLQADIVEDLKKFSTQQKLEVQGVLPSPIKGAKGNQEYFLWAKSICGKKCSYSDD